tara:strand:- start:240 stop:977 length:738 start_codon:yes stop_codon:yes gene_type:complete
MLNEPDRHNALSPQMVEDLGKCFERLNENKNTKIIILSSSGKSFCAGGDLEWMKTQINADRKTRIKEASKLASMLNKLFYIDKTIIGKVQGNAFGGGIGIMAICDIVLASIDIKMALTETRLGLIPATISPYVIRKIGEKNSIDLFTSARVITCAEGIKIGLIDYAVRKDELDDKLIEILLPYKLTAPEAVSNAKRLVKKLTNKIDRNLINFSIEALADSWENKESIEGINAFFNKKKPNWITEK